MFGFCPPGNETGPGFELLGDRIVKPHDVNEDLYQAYKYDFTFMSIRRDFPGDFFYTTLPDCGIPWYEALIGCRIRFSSGTKMGWAEGFARNLTELRGKWRLPLKVDDPWLERLRIVLERKKRDFSDCPIPLVLGRGLVDLLFAAIPTEEVVMGLTESKDEYADAMNEMAEMTIDVVNLEMAALRPFFGGYANRRGLWAPGTICMTQEDGSSLLSPRIFEDVILPCDRKIWAAFDFSMIHTHSPGLPLMIDGLITAPELTAIESMVDPGGPSVEVLMPLWKKIQSADKALLICSELDPDSVEEIANELKPNGLAFCISTGEPDKYDRLLGR
jgi:hypothetical protein